MNGEEVIRLKIVRWYYTIQIICMRYLSPCNFTLAADADGSQVRNQH